jgi:hypothetical protein
MRNIFLKFFIGISLLFILVNLCFSVNSKYSRTQIARDIYNQGKTYSQGCSGYISEILGISWEDADSIMGPSPVYIGSDNNYDYNNLYPGDIVGWKSDAGQGQAHVAVYIGAGDMKFLAVPGRGMQPKIYVNGFGNGMKLFRSARY